MWLNVFLQRWPKAKLTTPLTTLQKLNPEEGPSAGLILAWFLSFTKTLILRQTLIMQIECRPNLGRGFGPLAYGRAKTKNNP